MLVFTGNLLILENVAVDTDFDRPTSIVRGFFYTPLDKGQTFTESIIGYDIAIGDPGLYGSPIEYVILLNGYKIGELKQVNWVSSRINIELEDKHGFFKKDGSANVIELYIKTNPVYGHHSFTVSSLLTYNGNTTEPPSEDPSVGDPEVETGAGFNFFGETDPFKVILIMAGATMAVVGLASVSNIASRFPKSRS